MNGVPIRCDKHRTLVIVVMWLPPSQKVTDENPARSNYRRCNKPRNLLICLFLQRNLWLQFVLPCGILCMSDQIMRGVCTEYAKIRGCLGPSLLDEIVRLSCAHPLVFHQISHQKSNTVVTNRDRVQEWDTDASHSKMHKLLLGRRIQLKNK